MKYTYWIYFLFASTAVIASPVTIEEKFEKLYANHSSQGGDEENQISPSEILNQLRDKHKQLKVFYDQVHTLNPETAPETEYCELLEETNELKNEIRTLEAKWRDIQSDEVLAESEGYGIWQHDEATVADLVIEYGSTDYLYVIPPEVASQKLHVHSALMIPRDSWASLLETIFKHNGIGVREINVYAKQLYVLKQDFISFSTILVKKEQLEFFDKRERVAYIYSPPVAHLKQAFYFIERFRDPKTTFVYQVGAKVAIVGFQEDVKRLLTLCENVWEQGEEKTVRVVSSPKIQSEEVIKLLKSYFGNLSDPSRSMITLKGGHDLSAMPLANEGGVILVGAKSLVDKAEAVIQQAESQVKDPSELTVFWHTCSHSDPVDLAEILDRVYSSLIHSSIDIPQKEEGSPEPYFGPSLDGFDDDDDDDDLPSNFERVKPWSTRLKKPRAEKRADQNEERVKSGNFIPYPSTGSILMVVRKDMVSKIKEVIKRLDVPKRMVEIEVLLVERRVKNNSRSGINILKLGSAAKNVNQMGAEYHGYGTEGSNGLLEFIYSGMKNAKFPAIDLSYNFLLSQEDIRVTAAPSVITINHSPAVIAVTDQISINNGASPVETNKGFVFKDSYERADFGITIKLTPTIHEPEIDDPDEQVFVTLENDISFETIKKTDGASSHKPDVHKRQVKNHVRIADGQTVILGGLKNKSQEDRNDKIPFLGEVPGFGKLFGTNVLTDSSGEMFIFIKPKVIHDPKQDLIRIRDEKLKARPGDSQIFLDKIAESRKRSNEKMFKRSYELLFGVRTDGTVNLH